VLPCCLAKGLFECVFFFFFLAIKYQQDDLSCLLASIDPSYLFIFICFCTDLILLIHNTKFQTRTKQISIIPSSYMYNTNKVLSKESSKQWTN
jgi:hypothetical protein